MRQRRAGAVTEAEIVLAQVDSVAEHGAAADKPGMIVNVEVARPLREQRLDPFDLSAVLGHMRLHVEVVAGGEQRAGGLELRFAAGRRESWRHAVMVAALVVPPGDERGALVVSALGRVAERRRRVAIHQHLAGDHARAEAGRF